MTAQGLRLDLHYDGTTTGRPRKGKRVKVPEKPAKKKTRGIPNKHLQDGEKPKVRFEEEEEQSWKNAEKQETKMTVDCEQEGTNSEPGHMQSSASFSKGERACAYHSIVPAEHFYFMDDRHLTNNYTVLSAKGKSNRL